ncbi:MAG TPA: glutathione S-transferase family protein [Burkholderiales bacterium]|nr:glutathione S-transferase family protein [Burkholderiales bacterium]
MTIKLYSWPRSSGTRVSWALEELGLPYEYIELDAKKNEHRAPGYLSINPHGKVPALVDGSQAFFESGAILLHLGTKYGVEKKLFPPGGGQARADAISWTVWSGAELSTYLLQYVYHGLATPISFRKEDQSKAAADYGLMQLNRLLDTLEARFADHEYLLGEFTIPDVAVASWFAFGRMIGFKPEHHPRVTAWADRCMARPAFKRAK